MSERVICFVTIYNICEHSVAKIENIAKQCDLLVICDNSGKVASVDFANFKNAKYIYIGKNLGISAAFNFGLSVICDEINDSDLMLFFDQDSVIDAGHVKQMVFDYNYLEKQGINVGAMGAEFINVNTGCHSTPRSNKKISDSYICVNELITSSLMIRLHKLKQINYWNERFFLDYSDWDLCWRLKNKGFKQILTRNVIFKHPSGEEGRKFFGVNVVNEKPFRSYYQVREMLRALSADYTPNKISLLIGYLKKLFLQILIFPNRLIRLKFVIIGIYGFMHNHYGEIPGEYTK